MSKPNENEFLDRMRDALAPTRPSPGGELYSYEIKITTVDDATTRHCIYLIVNAQTEEAALERARQVLLDARFDAINSEPLTNDDDDDDYDDFDDDFDDDAARGFGFWDDRP